MENKGFTLIELLVVIAIIGLLATIVTVSLNSARAKARNTQRQANLKQIELALMMYYDVNGQFPEGGCSNGAWSYSTAAGPSGCANYVSGLSMYIASLPQTTGTSDYYGYSSRLGDNYQTYKLILVGAEGPNVSGTDYFAACPADCSGATWCGTYAPNNIGSGREKMYAVSYGAPRCEY